MAIPNWAGIREDFVIVGLREVDAVGDYNTAGLWQRIFWRCGQQRGCWRITLDSLAEETHLTKKQVRRSLDALRAAGWVETRRTGRDMVLTVPGYTPVQGIQSAPEGIQSAPEGIQSAPEGIRSPLIERDIVDGGARAGSGHSDGAETGRDERGPRPPMAAPRPRTGTRIPPQFELTAALREFASLKAPYVSDLEREHEKFCNYWESVPGAKGRKIDWCKTWQNWMMRASDETPEWRRPKSADTQIRKIQEYDGPNDSRMVSEHYAKCFEGEYCPHNAIGPVISDEYHFD